ncbi:3-dehydroquinate synthase [Clostridia bacterium]|nr:3-dehydroquinate synthase [Clostridia bacterium]
MITLCVGLNEKAYDILIEDGLLKQLGTLVRVNLIGDMTDSATGLSNIGKNEPRLGGIAVITDSNVWDHYGNTFTKSMENASLDFFTIIMDPGEQTKSLTELEKIYSAFSQGKLKRDGLIIAFGGGVIGDISGFAAATWNRGIDYVQVPTTLLAQVDSSVGGKTAINIREGKNLVGAFYQPRLVIIDPSLLNTLPVREYRSGMAEVIKYGAIRSKALFDKSAGEDKVSTQREAPQAQVSSEPVPAGLSEIIRECCSIKSGIVERDEFDRGERMLLNFGHTFGHAIEKSGGFQRYNHGEAVALGMVMAAEFGEKTGLSARGTASALRALLKTHGLEADCGYAPSELLTHMELDKKNEGGSIRLVLLKDIGEAFIHTISFSEFGKIFTR